ncbi:adiponectin receptor protein 1 [Novymonas esmeraldas]|uniref:Adiponectin receptor protein 1 n=1 Tax=Novymonas esmeraldas TaxID=1808958 RepID=A0AAW0EMC4_9TRYP
MPRRATDVTVEHSAPRRPSTEVQRQEDNRRLSDGQDGDELPQRGSAAASSPTTSQPPVYVTRTFPQHAPPHHDRTDSAESVRVGSLTNSPAETVVTPPFLPTGRHHDFFMDDDDSHSGGGGGDTQMSAQLRHINAQSPIAEFGAVMARRRSASAAGGASGDGAAGNAEAAATACIGAARPSSADPPAALEDADDVPLPVEPPEADVKTPDHDRRRRKRRFSLVAKAPPFDPARAQQWNLLTFGPNPALPLYAFDEIPHWQKYNPSIRTGYRAFYTMRMCFESLLGWHNETINVYSHLLTFVVFLVFTVLLYTTVLSKAITAPSLSASKLMYGIFCFGSLICMLNSSIYHLFNSHCNCRVMTAMGRLDFIGITILIVSSFLPPLYVMFHCHPVARTVYITAILVLGTAGIVGPWTDIFHEVVWVRVSVFVGLGCSGLVPAIHSIMIVPTSAASMSTMIGVLLMVLLYGIGVIFYVTQFPECRYPGHFDCWLSSHQLWHFFVSTAALVHYFNCVSMYQLWQVSDGMCG